MAFAALLAKHGRPAVADQGGWCGAPTWDNESKLMEHFEVVQSILDLFKSPRYLEIGVNQGHTFQELKAGKKIGVDPEYLFDVDAARRAYPENMYIAQTSDHFFNQNLGKIEKFDVIFIDGLHCFDQVLRDFLNSCEMLTDNGIIIIDDVVPSVFISSLPTVDMMFAMRHAEGSADATWMGDVYKLVFFISAFVPAFSYATVAENHGQTICWRQVRANTIQTLKEILNLDFTDVTLRRDVYNIKPHAAIMASAIERIKT